MFFADGMPASRLEKRVARSWAREVVEDVVNR